MTTTRTHPTHDDYVHAATTLWGDAGVFAYDTFDRFNLEHFDGRLPALPIVIGITAFGKCLGLTRYDELPRITLASNIFAPAPSGGANGSRRPRCGHREVEDVLLHEMIHAKLVLNGVDPSHNGQPWCDEITRLSPAVLGRDIQAAPVKVRRVEGEVRRLALPEHLTRDELARWPGSLRPKGWNPGRLIPVATY
jgi:hypothetical protein